MSFPAIPDGEPPDEELRFIFRSGRLCLQFCATVGERWRRGFERLLTPAHLTRWYAEAPVASVPVPVTGADLDDARTVRESVYRTAKALIEGQSPAAADEKIINHAAAAPPVPRMERGTLVLTPDGPDPAASALSAIARDAIGLFITADARRLRECRRHHRRPLQDGQPEARRSGERCIYPQIAADEERAAVDGAVGSCARPSRLRG